MTKFKLDKWFDTKREIDSVTTALTEAQLLLEAVKRNVDPEGAESHQERRAMYRAVNMHNRQFAQ